LSRVRVLMLAQAGDSTTIVFNALRREFDVVDVVLEPKVPAITLLRRRARRMGLPKVLGQMAFRTLLVPQLARSARARVEEICSEYELDRTPIPASNIVHVPSVNSERARELIGAFAPSLVVVNGTRIISEETLRCIDVPFVNVHVGITPLYRGVHGAYWALAERDHGNCGVTVHLVDNGVDTGGILGQGRIVPSDRDNFVTYPYLQYAAAIPLLLKILPALLAGRATVRPAPQGTSRLWSHPTLAEYLWNWWSARTR
jgi:methionyl-tRNA formyltransferase